MIWSGAEAVVRVVSCSGPVDWGVTVRSDKATVQATEELSFPFFVSTDDLMDLFNGVAIVLEGTGDLVAPPEGWKLST
jgi:hypothetical protein